MKKILMAAVAVSALTAGVASAASISSAKISNITVYTGSTATPYKIANETVFGTAGLSTTTTAGENVTVAKVVSGPLGVGNYTVSYTLSGPAGFASSVSNSALTTDVTGTCAVSSVVSSGGGASGTTITYAVTVSGTCSTTVADANQGPQFFTLDAPLKVTGLGDVTVVAAFTSGGTSIDNGAATARTLITNATGFTVTAAADTTTTQWLLAGTPAYSVLSADVTIGTFTVAPVTTGTTGPFVLATGAATSKVDNAAQAITSTAVVTGDVATLAIEINAVATTKNTAKTTSTLAAIASGTKPITVVSAVAPSASQGTTSYSLSLTPATASANYTAPGAITQALQSVTLEGTNFLAPWIAGSQSGTSSSQIRVSNNGGTAAGAVTLMLKSPTYNSGTTAGATSCSSSTLSKLASISAGGELVLSTDDLTTCFGAFKRGDVVVTIQAPEDNLTAKARLTTTAGGISEISLGGLNVTNQTY